MPLSDYIPQLFGTAPQGYQGLLGEDQTQALQKQANLQGLLSAAGALAQGMSAQGPRRSATQNILSALGSGFGATGQAYQQGLQQQIQQQQLAAQQRQLTGAELLKQKYPDLSTMIDTNLPGAMRIIADIEQEKRQPKLTTAKPGEVVIDPTGKVIYTAASSPTAKILTAEEVKAKGLPEGIVYQEKPDGTISAIEGVKPTQFSGEYANVALTKYGVADISKLTPDQRLNVGREVERLPASKSAASAPKVNVNVANKTFEQEFGKGVADAVNATYNNAVGAQDTLNTIASIKPLVKEGVYAGPIASAPLRTIDQLASSFGVASGTTEQKLARTAEAMQGLAKIELSAAKGMKGQGAITDFERGLISRAAAGDFSKFTQKEVITLLDALEKTSKYTIQIHQTNLDRLKKNDKTKDLAPFFELNQVRTYDPVTGTLK